MRLLNKLLICSGEQVKFINLRSFELPERLNTVALRKDTERDVLLVVNSKKRKIFLIFKM